MSCYNNFVNCNILPHILSSITKYPLKNKTWKSSWERSSPDVSIFCCGISISEPWGWAICVKQLPPLKICLMKCLGFSETWALILPCNVDGSLDFAAERWRFLTDVGLIRVVQMQCFPSIDTARRQVKGFKLVTIKRKKEKPKNQEKSHTGFKLQMWRWT